MARLIPLTKSVPQDCVSAAVWSAGQRLWPPLSSHLRNRHLYLWQRHLWWCKQYRYDDCRPSSSGNRWYVVVVAFRRDRNGANAWIAGGVNVLIEIVVCDMVPLRERGNYLAIIFGLIALGTALGPVVRVFPPYHP